MPEDISDRLLHFGAYVILGALLMVGWSAFISTFRGRDYALAGLTGVLYGLTDEWHQSFVSQRHPSLADVGFDAVGILTALMIVYAVQRRKLKTKN